MIRVFITMAVFLLACQFSHANSQIDKKAIQLGLGAVLKGVLQPNRRVHHKKIHRVNQPLGLQTSSRWQKIDTKNGLGVATCNKSGNSYACFAIRCGKGRGIEFAFLFNHGSYENSLTGRLRVNNGVQDNLPFIAVKEGGELVSPLDKSKHAGLIDGLQSGRNFIFDIGIEHKFSLKGSRKQINRALLMCRGDAQNVPPIVSKPTPIIPLVTDSSNRKLSVEKEGNDPVIQNVFDFVPPTKVCSNKYLSWKNEEGYSAFVATTGKNIECFASSEKGTIKLAFDTAIQKCFDKVRVNSEAQSCKLISIKSQSNLPKRNFTKPLPQTSFSSSTNSLYFQRNLVRWKGSTDKSSAYKMVPEKFFYWSKEHEKSILKLGMPPKEGKERRIYFAKYRSRLEEIRSEIVSKYGFGSPMEGSVLIDIARALENELDPYNIEKLSIEEQFANRKLAGPLFMEGIRYLGNIASYDVGIYRSTLIQRRISAILDLISHKRIRTDLDNQGRLPNASDYYIKAALLHEELYGKDLLQYGWLVSAFKLSKSPAKRLEIYNAMRMIADKLNDPVMNFFVLLQGAISFVGNDPENAAISLRNAVAIHRSLPRNYRRKIDLFESSNLGLIGNNQDAISKISARSEVNYILYLYTSQYFKGKHHTNNAGATSLPFMMARLIDLDNKPAVDLVFKVLSRDGWGPDGRPMSKFSSNMFFAEYFSDLGAVEVSTKFYQRAIALLGKKRRDQRKRFAVLLKLSKLHYDNGGFGEANKYINASVKISKIRKINLKRSQKLELQSLLKDIRREENGLEFRLAAAAEEFDQDVKKVCKSVEKGINKEAWYEYSEKINLYLNRDDAVSRLLVASDTSKYLLSCFVNTLNNLSGVYGNRNGIDPGYILKYIIILAGLRNSLTDIEQILDFITRKENWPIIQSQYNSKYFNKDQLSALVSVYYGLALSGKKSIFRKYMIDVIDLIKPATLNDRIIEFYSPTTQLAQIGQIMKLEGFDEISQLIYEALQRWEEVEGFSHSNPKCSLAESCEFFALISQSSGNQANATNLYESMSLKFVTSLSGASISVNEGAEISRLALSEGKIRESIGDYRAAIVLYQEAGGSRLVARDTSDFSNLQSVQAAEVLARSFQQIGDNTKALQITSKVAGFLGKRISAGQTFESDLVVRWASRLRGLAQTHLDILAEQDTQTSQQFSESFQLGQFLQATNTSTTLGKLAARTRSKNKQTAQLIRRYQDTGAQIESKYGKLAGANENTTQKLLKQISRLESELKTISVELNVESKNYSSYASLQIASLEEIRKTLKPAEAMLSVFVGQLNSYVWWLSPTNFKYTRLDISKNELSSLVSEIRKGMALEAGSQTDNKGLPVTPFSFKSSSRMFELLFSNINSEIDNVDHLLFVPSGPLDSLPPAVLLTEGINFEQLDNEEFRSVKIPWLIRKMAISNLPSIAAAKILNEVSFHSSASKPFFGIGDPQLEDRDVATSKGISINDVVSIQGRIAVEDLKRISSLPETADELRSMASILGGDVTTDLLLRNDANEISVKQYDLEDYRIIAFATHGFLAGDLEGLREPGLVLTPPEKITKNNDGLLLASEISQLKLNADLVILSACNTAGSNGEPGAEGLSGIAQAFFFAGARGLLVSHWLVLSEPTVFITTGMLKAANDNNISHAKGLRQTMLKMIDKEGPVRFAHPTVWAPFSLVAR